MSASSFRLKPHEVCALSTNLDARKKKVRTRVTRRKRQTTTDNEQKTHNDFPLLHDVAAQSVALDDGHDDALG